ncbi:MAG TPA: DUF5665 domain-containing protein [Candidatus Saccharimonas sp.]|jgi:hypothetical protein|nr:DUF5665 domain-containing protein [Patescibacteria group bacterium]MCA9335602.1 hypothetical protein [Candidatus Saccharibacteria bacterium]MCA9336354.1 hypothetical protein [Candidatus Saccharibacteria bacterium]HPQ82454.1 DUF5665 domain-containing protein [Candidatus Saccharimonas sp.]
MPLTFWKKLKKNIQEGNERGARQSVLEELFNDFNRNRFSVYKFNFFRGIFFGLGSVLGGTVVLAVLVWLLNLTGHLVPGVAGFIDHVVELMQTAKQ